MTNPTTLRDWPECWSAHRSTVLLGMCATTCGLLGIAALHASPWLAVPLVTASITFGLDARRVAALAERRQWVRRYAAATGADLASVNRMVDRELWLGCPAPWERP